MRISSAFPSDYLKAADLQGRAVTVTIARVSMQDMNGEPKPILYFEGKERGMVLNKTNATKISEMFGDETDNWIGEEVILYEAMVEFQGKTVPAIRVRLAPRKRNGDSDGDRLERASRPKTQPPEPGPFENDVPF